MMRVGAIDPTPSFEEKVRVPGAAFLAVNSSPTRKAFNRHNYWVEIHDEMYDAYGGICMYCASWTPRTPKGGALQQTSIDHFLPKSKAPQLAYAWTNFRLSRTDLNSNKGTDVYVPDPFGIQSHWFEVDFATWRVGPSASAPEYIRQRIRTAFVRLGMNGQFYIDERQGAAALYVHNPTDRAQLQQLYPFLVAELERQNQGSTLFADLRALLPLP